MRHSFIALFSLLGFGCVDRSFAPADELTAAGDHDVLFPDGPPSESCVLNIPRKCPTRTLWTITYATNQLTGRTTTISSRHANVAGFSFGAVNNQCTASTDFVATGVVSYMGTRSLPTGVSYAITPDNKGIQFVKDGQPTSIYNGAGRAPLCGMSCDSTMQRTSDASGTCSAPPTDQQGHQLATVSADGISRDVRMAGSVDRVDFDNSTGVISLYCRMTLPKSALYTNPNRRPDDVIAASGRTFQRGYEFSGSTLSTKCNDFAGMRCANQPGACINQVKQECIDAFSQPDPCGGDFEDPR